MRRIVFSTVAVVCFGLSGSARAAEEGVSLTIYTDNFGVVRQSRQMAFEEGVNTIRFTDVASEIDPTSVDFKCLSSPGAVSILEQNYEYDLVDTDSLLKRYVDKEIIVEVKGNGADTGRKATGKLMGARGNSLILLNANNQIEVIDTGSVEAVLLKEMPEDLVTKPTLVWLAQAEKGGEELCQVTYTTGQIGWKADYIGVLSSDEKSLDFSGWVTIDNKSGARYNDAGIKLIAGDVRRVERPRPVLREKVMAMEAAAPAFEEKAFMEYHLYTLGRKSTINNNQVKQIEFIEPATGVSVQKLYIYDRTQQPDKVQIKLEFENKEENKLGIALPKGKIRVFKRDPADQALEFVGEDLIDHTPRKEKLLLYIGNAFDIVPEYTLVNSQHGRRTTTETHRIELRNRKDTAVEVYVDEKFSPWMNWTIDKSTVEYEKRNATTARFKVKVGADSTATLEYTVTQTW